MNQSNPKIYGDYINLPKDKKDNVILICNVLHDLLDNPGCSYETINTKNGIIEIYPKDLQIESNISLICNKLRSVANYYGCYVLFDKGDNANLGQLIILMNIFEKKSAIFDKLPMRETPGLVLDKEFLNELHDKDYQKSLVELIGKIETMIVPDVTDSPYKLSTRACLRGFDILFENTSTIQTNKLNKVVKLLDNWSMSRSGLIGSKGCRFTKATLYQDSRGFRLNFCESKKRKRQDESDDSDDSADEPPQKRRKTTLNSIDNKPLLPIQTTADLYGSAVNTKYKH